MRPTLETLTPRLDRTCMDVLGDTILYRPAGATAFESVKVHADYSDAERAFDAAQVIDQDVSLAVLMVDVPAKPAKTVRIILPKVPGKVYRPTNVRRDEAGTMWLFELAEQPVG